MNHVQLGSKVFAINCMFRTQVNMRLCVNICVSALEILVIIRDNVDRNLEESFITNAEKVRFPVHLDPIVVDDKFHIIKSTISLLISQYQCGSKDETRTKNMEKEIRCEMMTRKEMMLYE